MFAPIYKYICRCRCTLLSFVYLKENGYNANFLLTFHYILPLYCTYCMCVCVCVNRFPALQDMLPYISSILFNFPMYLHSIGQETTDIHIKMHSKMDLIPEY